jgi:hypothetical protein
MATANYVLLQRITTTTSVASVTFSGIPQTGYTDLKIVMSGRTTGTDSPVKIEFNGVTTGYSWRRIYGDGTAASSQAASADAYSLHVDTSSKTANTFSSSDIYIPNYTSGNQKSFSIETALESNSGSAGAGELFLMAGLSTSISAITSIALTHLNANLVAGSSFSLYGIADVNTTPKLAPKADGGDIIQTDGTYWYHAFTGSGIFKPQVNLTADVMVLAGGGGGGARVGGGGGAGGLVYLSAQGLTTTNYTIAVGAGAAATVQSSNVGAVGISGSNSSFGGTVATAGGGGGAYSNIAALSGGSGGGAGGYNSGGFVNGAAGTSGQGNAGGGSANGGAGGGGGAGAAGTTGTTNTGGTGGAGVNTYSAWATATNTGVSGYYAGGGGGSADTTAGAGGAGGGGAATTGTATPATSGTANTGSGGGGVRNSADGNNFYSGAGGSGIIIVRYAV